MVAPEDSIPEERERERIVPELLRRMLEAGYEKLSDGPENLRQFVSDLKLPKEALALLLAQVEDGRHGLYRAVAGEVREFLQRTTLSEEIKRAISGLTLEIKTEIRVVPKESSPGKAATQAANSEGLSEKEQPLSGSGTPRDSARPKPTTE